MYWAAIATSVPVSRCGPFAQGPPAPKTRPPGPDDPRTTALHHRAVRPGCQGRDQPARVLGDPLTLGVEPHPESVECSQPEVPAPVFSIRPGHRPPGQLNPGVPKWFGRKGHGLLPDELESREFGLLSGQQIDHHLTAES